MKSLALASVAVCAACATTRPLPLAESPHQAVLALEDAWTNAVVRRDSVTVRGVLDSGFVFTTSAPAPASRQVYLAEVVRPARTVTHIELKRRAVRVYGDAAVTTGQATVLGDRSGIPFGVIVRYTNTFVRQDGRWRAIASQVTIEDYEPGA